MTNIQPAEDGRVETDHISGAANGRFRESPKKAHPPIPDFLRRD
jgi:hypothetical protein